MEKIREQYLSALSAAQRGLESGGIPIGSALYCGDTLIATGHNQRVQKSSPILHAEIDCLGNAGRPDPKWKGKLVLFTTLSPCYMCAGAALIYGVSEVVIGENKTFAESEDLLISKGIRIHQLQDEKTFAMFSDWTRKNPEIWFEDIGR
jgi:cytosine/creatinine deaminase